ncbi:hypothetical protein ACTXT7_005364 [Hymenolepis weldensis]
MQVGVPEIAGWRLVVRGAGCDAAVRILLENLGLAIGWQEVQKTGSSSPVVGSGSGGSGGSGVFATPDTSTENLAEQLRHWRSVALVARAEAVCERAKSRALTAELARARCDLDMAEKELGLLRKKLSMLESALAASRSSLAGPSATTTVTREFR